MRFTSTLFPTSTLQKALLRNQKQLTVKRYRPSSNRSFTISQPAGQPSQIMYPYNRIPLQEPQTMQHVSRSSPPQPTWALSQIHNPYYQIQRGPNDSQQMVAKTDVTSAHSPALSTATFRDDMSAHESMGSGPNYFPGVIDTSKSRNLSISGIRV